MSKDQFVIGVDYGTDSVRSVIVDAENGREIASSVFNYPRWQQGQYCNAAQNQFRQHPLDYVEGLEQTIKDCIKKAGGVSVASAIKAISVDTTGSTPVAVNAAGVPLALTPGFENNPNAMFVLWKDHTGVKEAGEINALVEWVKMGAPNPRTDAGSQGGSEYGNYDWEKARRHWSFQQVKDQAPPPVTSITTSALPHSQE